MSPLALGRGSAQQPQHRNNRDVDALYFHLRARYSLHAIDATEHFHAIDATSPAHDDLLHAEQAH